MERRRFRVRIAVQVSHGLRGSVGSHAAAPGESISSGFRRLLVSLIAPGIIRIDKKAWRPVFAALDDVLRVPGRSGRGGVPWGHFTNPPGGSMTSPDAWRRRIGARHRVRKWT
jgi:hypothetical protein